MMLVYLSVVLLANIVCTDATCQSKTTCEGNYFSISCPPEQSILIENAVFGGTRSGRRIREHCLSNSRRATRVTSKLCNGHNSCMFRVTCELFGCTCAEFKRYLRVRYTCTPNKPSVHCGINEVLAPCQDLCPKMCPEVNVTRPTVCMELCKGPGCVCTEGCVRDRKSMMCIKEEYCSVPGDNNEEFTLCDADKQRMCPEEFIINTGAILFPGTCTPGYVCKAGFVRDPFQRTCVLPQHCPIID